MVELSDDMKAAFSCTDAEQQLAETLADLAFSEAEPGVRPLVYVELAARILAQTAILAVAHENKGSAAPFRAEAGARLCAPMPSSERCCCLGRKAHEASERHHNHAPLAGRPQQ